MNEFRKGQAPYGFRWKDGSLEVVPGEAQTRKLAFEHFVKLRSKGAVARKLNELGRFTRREGKWSDMQVGRILGCSSAIGRYVAASERGASLTVDSSVADPDASFIACPPLIPLDLWNQVRTMLSKVAEPEGESKGAKTERLFAGLIFCECGERMQLPSDGKKYGCPACHRKIGLPELEKIFVEDLTELVGDHPRFQAALTATPADLDLAAVESNLAEASAERGRLEELMIGGVISAKRYGELEAVSQDRIKTARNQVKELRMRKAVSESPKISETEPATTFEKRWNRLSVAGKNRIARAFVDRLIVGDDAVELTYLISDSTSKDAPLAQQTRSPTNQEPNKPSRDVRRKRGSSLHPPAQAGAALRSERPEPSEAERADIAQRPEPFPPARREQEPQKTRPNQGGSAHRAGKFVGLFADPQVVTCCHLRCHFPTFQPASIF